MHPHDVHAVLERILLELRALDQSEWAMVRVYSRAQFLIEYFVKESGAQEFKMHYFEVESCESLDRLLQGGKSGSLLRRWVLRKGLGT